MIVHAHEPPSNPLGVAIVVHGRNGAAHAGHMIPLLSACLDRRLMVIAPDLCHSSGNSSAGNGSAFTISTHVADVETVAAWAASYAPHRPGTPRLAVGHSMGAYAAVRLVAEHLEDYCGLLTVSPVISGRALIRARFAMGDAAVTRLRHELASAFEEWPAHDLSLAAAAIGLPSAVIVGAEDTITPPTDAEHLAAMFGRCVWHDVIPGAHHCPVGPAYELSVQCALERLLAG